MVIGGVSCMMHAVERLAAAWGVAGRERATERARRRGGEPGEGAPKVGDLRDCRHRGQRRRRRRPVCSGGKLRSRMVRVREVASLERLCLAGYQRLVEQLAEGLGEAVVRGVGLEEQVTASCTIVHCLLSGGKIHCLMCYCLLDG